MNIKLDINFIVTFAITLIALIFFILLINSIFGITVATVVGTFIAGVAIKLFDRLDYTPTITLTTPKHPKGFLLSLFISVCLIIAPIQLLGGIVSYLNILFGDDFICRPYFLLIIIIFDWGSFIISGLFIGKLYPERALLLTSIAAVLGITTIFPDVYSLEVNDKTQKIMECIFGKLSEKEFADNLQPFKIGAIVGLIIRAYIAIIFARLSSKKIISKKTNTQGKLKAAQRITGG